jgi:putative glutamine amidotransferase
MLALGAAYLDAVAAAGGIPVILAPLPAPETESLLDRLDGICLSGGPDLDPAAYGAHAHPLLGPTEPEVDAFELDLVRRAQRRGLPVLAICRGLQVLNVARGGRLIQHLPDAVGTDVTHRQANPASQATHSVTVNPGTCLEQLVGRTRVKVNSFHHQSVASLGRGLRVAARSADGVIEAIEAPADPFVVGVQWHAECLVHEPEHAALFTALVDASLDHRSMGTELAA